MQVLGHKQREREALQREAAAECLPKPARRFFQE
jgi:hypothetical protein